MSDATVSVAAPRPVTMPAPPCAPATATVATGRTDPVIRPLRRGDARHVRRVFRATLLVGRPLPVDDVDFRDYESVCLDWYLRNGTVLVVEHEQRVRGYLLACLDQHAYDHWVRARAIRWGARQLGAIATGALSGDGRRFVLHRIRDALVSWRSAPPAPYGAHAHINLERSLRGSSVGRQLVAAMDGLVRDAGLDGWFGEMNVPPHRSLTAIERGGGIVMHRQRNHTFSWLLGCAVERATIARPLLGRSLDVPDVVPDLRGRPGASTART